VAHQLQRNDIAAGPTHGVHEYRGRSDGSSALERGCSGQLLHFYRQTALVTSPLMQSPSIHNSEVIPGAQ